MPKQKHRLDILVLAAAALITLVTGAGATPPPAPKGYHWESNPLFTDEFKGEKLDATRWLDHHPRWQGRPPAKFMPENVAVKDGKLRLRNSVLNPPQGEFNIAGAAVVSKSSEAHFGYYEVSMKASSISMSSTFWFSNKGVKYGKRHISQELDVQEAVGGGKLKPDRKHFMHSNTHVWVREGGEKFDKATPENARIEPPADEAFHVYGVWWVDANTMHFYHNNELKFTLHPNTDFHSTPFENPMQLNLVTETYDWETPPTPEELSDDTRNTTYYDWVRGYVLAKDKAAPASTKPPKSE